MARVTERTKDYDLCTCGETKRKVAEQCWNCFNSNRPEAHNKGARRTPTRLKNGCLVLNTTKGNKGYAKLNSHKLAHRVVWEEFYETPIPEGMTVDHLCHNDAVLRGECEGGETCLHRACIEITHLTLADRVENWENGTRGGRKPSPERFCACGNKKRRVNNKTCADCKTARKVV